MAEKESIKTEEQQATQTPMLKRVSHNYLPVSNVELASKWYKETLGLTVRPRGSAEGAILVLGNGQWLFLLETKEKKTANFMTDQWEGDQYEMFSLTFEVENIVEIHKRLRESGVYVEPISDQGSCGLQFKFKDPDGNKFNVWQDAE
ncbi:VOC family protein [Paenibacillus popilliae]|uniref:VOC family protein n=1 Tax=Paenibacillus popilliae TaxID=78057 RepID=A0ABY3AH90_PAEPP|nr:VOC family protein [Paenibacillus sp. SDF0028]TQR40904.1 VOC family protein [Paenibacillus sp. SDF0028]